MKLTNPTDDELNAAFAEFAYGKRCSKCGKFHDKYNEGVREEALQFTTSVDAVMPWLDKHDAIITHAFNESDWRVVVLGGRCNSAKTLARAAVIALLRAAGVEVEGCA